ncbi:MAG: hypothetical protein KA126_00180 [Candidatus Hydrothermae bacterium]|nr:hypothetical protein [Candidatus Hydrothermae bacterium]
MMLLLVCFVFSSVSFYDPVFMKDYSADFMKIRRDNILYNADSYIWFSEVPVTDVPTLSFTPSLKTIFNVSSGNTYINTYLDLEFDAGVKIDNFALAATLDFFNFNEPLKIPYYAPLADNQYFMYSFDEQPIIGGANILDINVRNAYIKYTSGSFDLTVGRSDVKIGEGMLFSGISYPLDHIYRINFKFQNFHVTSAFAATPDTFLSKTIAYQALEWKPFSSLTLTLYEAVSHSEEDYFKYFNPLTLYYERQRRGKSNSDNLIGGASVKWNFGGKYSIFCDFLNDDVVIFQGNTSKYGVLAGFESIVTPNSILRFHAVAIPRFTYTHVSDTNAWHLMGVPLGYPRGNDLLDFYLSYILFFNDKSSLTLRAAQLNKGEGSLVEHWEGSGFPRNMPYPTGDVCRELFLMVGFQKGCFYGGAFGDLEYNSKNHRYGLFLNIQSRVLSLKF